MQHRIGLGNDWIWNHKIQNRVAEKIKFVEKWMILKTSLLPSMMHHWAFCNAGQHASETPAAHISHLHSHLFPQLSKIFVIWESHKHILSIYRNGIMWEVQYLVKSVFKPLITFNKILSHELQLKREFIWCISS